MEKRPAITNGYEQRGHQPSSVQKGIQPTPISNVGKPPSTGTSIHKPSNNS